jgi:hypothetical protein
MFKRNQTEGDDAPETPIEEAVKAVEAVERTTCYPRDGAAPPPVAGEPRTTVYRQAIPWTRRGYDTVN